MLNIKGPLLANCEALLRVPTAPFCEHWMLQGLDLLLSRIPEVECVADAWGNRIVTLRPELLESAAPLVFVAHLDHPGFVFPAFQSGIRLEAYFEGRVDDEFFMGSEVRVFCDADDPGTVGIVTECNPRGGKNDNRFVVIELEKPVINPVLGMWNVEAFGCREGVIYGRACDDLCGAAAMLTALEVLAQQAEELKQPVKFIFTRGEEAGFCGTLCLLNSKEREEILPAKSHVLSVEISSETKGVALGDGAILRVGDKAGSFDHRLLNEYWTLLNGMESGKRPNVRRALMDRGTCEATAFVAYGYRSAGICATVRGYHNMNRATGEIVAESVSVSDLTALTEMMVILANSVSTDSPSTEWDERFAVLLEKGRRLLV